MQRRFSGSRSFVVLVALCAGLVAAGGVSPAVGSAATGTAARALADPVLKRAAPAVCAAVPRCRVVARLDVTGDGDRDVVALARRGKDGAERGAVLGRVRTPEGRLASARRKTRFWAGSLWQGAGRLDGRPGRDLVVGRVQGAHARYFSVLTWRHGALEHLDAPGRPHYWGVDASVSTSFGWQHRPVDPRGVMRKRLAIRQGDATAGPFRGEVTTYRWTRAGWDRTARRVVDPLPDERAARWAGWRVRGVDRW